MNHTLKLIALVVLVASAAFGQATMTQTTLSAAVGASDDYVTVASATGITAAGVNNVVNTILYVDREAMAVRSLSGTRVQVFRGQNGSRQTAHASGATVYAGPPNYYGNYDPVGPCTSTSEPALPKVIIPTGNVWNCVSSAWVLASKSTDVLVTAVAAAPGTQRAIRGEYTTAATMTSGNLVGVRGAVTIPTAGTVSGAYLYGTQGKVITGTGSFSGTSLAGIYGQLDVTGGTISAGNVAAVQANIYGLTSGTNAIINGVYVEHAGGGIMNSFARFFGKTTYVFDIETNVHNQASSTCTPSAVTGATGGLKVLVDGVVRWIPLAATCP